MRKDRKMRGFTLVELLIVLLILGILIGLAVPRYLASIDKSKETTFCSNVRNVISAMEAWRMDTGTTAYPATADVLNGSIIQSASYFSQPPENPYTNATLMAQPDDPTDRGQFKYALNATFSYTVSTNPDCGIR